MDALDLSQKSLGQAIGFSQGYMSQIVAGQRPISRAILQKLAKNYPTVNVHWLITGEGNKFLEGGIHEHRPDKSNDPFEALRSLLEKHERRLDEYEKEINELREEVRLLKEGREYESKG